MTTKPSLQELLASPPARLVKAVRDAGFRDVAEARRVAEQAAGLRSTALPTERQAARARAAQQVVDLGHLWSGGQDADFPPMKIGGQSGKVLKRLLDRRANAQRQQEAALAQERWDRVDDLEAEIADLDHHVLSTLHHASEAEHHEDVEIEAETGFLRLFVRGIRAWDAGVSDEEWPYRTEGAQLKHEWLGYLRAHMNRWQEATTSHGHVVPQVSADTLSDAEVVEFGRALQRDHERRIRRMKNKWTRPEDERARLLRHLALVRMSKLPAWARKALLGGASLDPAKVVRQSRLNLPSDYKLPPRPPRPPRGSSARTKPSLRGLMAESPPRGRR